MEFSETTYVECCWFVLWDGGDWMLTLYRNGDAGPWEGEYRFRHYVDDKVFNSADRKSFYTLDLAGLTLPVIVEKIDGVARLLFEKSDGKLYKVPIGGGFDVFKAAMDDLPFMHTKVIPKGSGE